MVLKCLTIILGRQPATNYYFEKHVEETEVQRCKVIYYSVIQSYDS